MLERPEQPHTQWWRWLLMPFAAVIGAMAGAILFALLHWFGLKIQGGFSEDGWMFRYILPVLSSGVFGWLYVTISCSVAPRGKVIAGTVMVTLLVLVSFLSIAIAWTLPRYSIGESIQQTVGSVVSMVVAIATLVQFHSEQFRRAA